MGDYIWRRVGLDGGILASELDVDQYGALRGLENGVRTRLLAARVAIAGESGRRVRGNVDLS